MTITFCASPQCGVRVIGTELFAIAGKKRARGGTRTMVPQDAPQYFAESQ